MGSGGVAVAGEGGARDCASVMGSLMRGCQRGVGREKEKRARPKSARRAREKVEKRSRTRSDWR